MYRCFFILQTVSIYQFYNTLCINKHQRRHQSHGITSKNREKSFCVHLMANASKELFVGIQNRFLRCVCRDIHLLCLPEFIHVVNTSG